MPFLKNNKGNLKINCGFTLIELLVVIAIIGVLSAIILASVRSAKAKARDARRLNDMRQIANALELYYLDCGQYPAITCYDSCASGGWETSDKEPSGEFMEYLAPYLKTAIDPVNKRVEGFSFFGPRPGNYFYAYYRYVPNIPDEIDISDYCPEISHPAVVLAISQLEEMVPQDLPEEGMPLPENIKLPRARCGDPGLDGICTVDEYSVFRQCRDWSQEFDYSILLLE